MPRVKVTEALAFRRPFFSFEFFPPKNDEGAEQLMRTVRTLRDLHPAFVSVTYGAGGSTRARTVETAKRIHRESSLTVVAHITCVQSTRDEMRLLLREIAEAGIQNVLALRGDPPKGETAFTAREDGFKNSTELVQLLKAEFNFCVGGGCYPETHIEAPDAQTDLSCLEGKVRAGTDFLITQMFFDNDRYFAFTERARRQGITAPIIPGIIPITNYASITKMTSMSGASIPDQLREALDARKDEPEAVAELGVAFATAQCVDLLTRGAPGIHFYTLNKSPATRAVVSALLATQKFRTGNTADALG
jgi:methylenetetrahydrofolate reductase (NADPH)